MWLDATVVKVREGGRVVNMAAVVCERSSPNWRRIHSTNVLERLHREINRRCNVVGIFRNARSALRLVGAVLEEQGDEWRAVRRYLSLGSIDLFHRSSPRSSKSPPWKSARR